MATDIKILKDVSIPKPKTILEAIEIDDRLEYRAIPEKLHTFILENDMEGKILAFFFEHEGEEYNVHLTETLVNQIKRYQKRVEGTPRIILYVEPETGRRIPIKAVSSLFVQIPLKEVWEKAVAKLLPDLEEGEDPFQYIEQTVINNAIIAQFPNKSTAYQEDGTYDEHEAYVINPAIVLSANLAERAFQLGLVIGVMSCVNQIFSFFGNSRVVHNKHQIEAGDFSIEKAIDNLLANLVTLEELIAEAKAKVLLPSHAPVFYWKGCKGQARNLEKTFDEHAKMVVRKGKGNITLWDGLQNLTQVSTHQVANYNSSVEMSTRAGDLLISLGKLEDDDFVNALGYYMSNKRKSQGQEAWKKETPFFQRVQLRALMAYTSILLEELYDAEVAAYEKTQDAIRPRSDEEEVVRSLTEALAIPPPHFKLGLDYLSEKEQDQEARAAEREAREAEDSPEDIDLQPEYHETEEEPEPEDDEQEEE